jgi:SAM-dependent methyltransferase
MFEAWLSKARDRYLADLTQPELTRALRALSSIYVERRSKLTSGDAMGTAGKRAAFALFYGPLHFLTVREIARSLNARAGAPAQVIDLGCGTGAAGGAWALETGARIDGFDVNAWAIAEAGWTYRTLGLGGSARRVPIDRVKLHDSRSDLIVAFVLNEVPDDTRERMRSRLFEAARHGHRLLIVEPLARAAAPWWAGWERDVLEGGGRADEWRFRVALPEFLRTLDKGAGLDHRELTARTLAIGF